MTYDSAVKRLCRTLSHLCFEESGQTMVMAALMLPVLVGSVGMAIDVGYAFDYRRQMQMAADSGALAGTRAVRANPAITASALAAVVNLDATQNGFEAGKKSVTVDVCRPGINLTCSTLYTYTPGNNAVKVTITQPKATFLSGVLGINSLNIGVNAVAASAPTGLATANVVVLDDQCTSATFDASGGTDIVVTGRIWVNSCDQNAAKVTGGSDIIAADGVFLSCNVAGSCGNYTEGGGSQFLPTPTVGNPQVSDPLEDLPNPVPTGTIYNNPNINSGTHTLYPGIYNKGITLKGGTITFQPGIYFIDGDTVEFSGGATVLGDGVMFYAYNSSNLIIQNPSTVVTMSAPTTGIYKGIYWFQDRANAKDVNITAGALVNISGTFYVSNPGSTMKFAGNADSGKLASYTVFVTWHFTISGGATFNSDFTTVGGTPLRGGLALSE